MIHDRNRNRHQGDPMKKIVGFVLLCAFAACAHSKAAGGGGTTPPASGPASSAPMGEGGPGNMPHPCG
jgi:hypothetical protein